MKKKDKFKGFIPLVCTTLIIVGITVAAVVWMFDRVDAYRVIKIEEHNGEILLQHEEKEMTMSENNRYCGMNLQSGDVVTTYDAAHMVLLLDSDKYVYADENSCFSVMTADNEENRKIKINLEYGKALCEIENKLSEEATFEVETPNATASVRGTIFGVYYDVENNETKVEVLEGAVEIKTPTETKMVEAGSTLLISGNEGTTIEGTAPMGITPEEAIPGETQPSDFENVISIMEGEEPAEGSVEGHTILDDSEQKEYIVVYSAAAMLLGNGEGIYIFESGNTIASEEMEMIGAELSNQFNGIYGNVNVFGYPIKVTYNRIPAFAMGLVKDFCVDSEKYMRDVTVETLGIGEVQESEIIEIIMDFMFDYKVIKSTPYDFYNGLGFIE